jgi:mannose/fructose-specific phosphotransferase system component IIA
VVVVSGLNLPILLDYLHNRESYGVRELAERLLKKGQDSIRLQFPPAA